VLVTAFLGWGRYKVAETVVLLFRSAAGADSRLQAQAVDHAIALQFCAVGCAEVDAAP
jgi:hypothetical protein